MSSPFYVFFAALCGLIFGSSAIYVGVTWWQDFIPEVEALNFLFLIVFASLGILSTSVGVSMLWQALKTTWRKLEEAPIEDSDLPSLKI